MPRPSALEEVGNVKGATVCDDRSFVQLTVAQIPLSQPSRRCFEG